MADSHNNKSNYMDTLVQINVDVPITPNWNIDPESHLGSKTA